MLFNTKFYSALDRWADLAEQGFSIARSSAIQEKDGSSSYTLDLPGFSKDEIEVSTEEDRIVRISARSKNNQRDPIDYSVLAPQNTDLNNLKAKLENGVLTITFNPLPKAKAKTVLIE